MMNAPDCNGQPALSVIIPCYMDAAYLPRCLSSLLDQTLDRDRFEVIVVLNGPPDGAAEIAAKCAHENEGLSLQVVLAEPAGVSEARNRGLDIARGDYIVFLDADDRITSQYLEQLSAAADGSSNAICLATIRDVVDEDNSDYQDNYVSRQIENFKGRLVTPDEIPAALSLNACKAIPRSLAQCVRFREGLRSGEDVVYYCELFAAHKFLFRVVDEPERAIYLRTIREQSVSRQDLSFEFHISQRLDVIEHLTEIRSSSARDVGSLIETRICAQVDMMSRYLKIFPIEHQRVVDLVESRQLHQFPYDRLNRGRASGLVLSYCFPPDSDTSGIVMAKRIRARAAVVDVISNDMSKIRLRDDSLQRLAQPYIDRHFVIGAKPGFANWARFMEHMDAGLQAVAQLTRNWRKPYGYIHSRAVWPASHLLAAQVKLLHSEVEWIAEFSDPVSRGVDGARRKAPIGDVSQASCLVGAIERQGFSLERPIDAMQLCELSAYALADSIIFTNENQLEYMLSLLPASQQTTVAERSVVSAHPVLPPEHYGYSTRAPSRCKSSSQTTPVCIAYFGAFYKTRNLGEVLLALTRLEDVIAKRVKLDIYTNNPKTADAVVADLRLCERVSVGPYLPYYEFLQRCTQVDCLLVNDAVTFETHPTNPYLPSKWSDYFGSGTPIWGIVEEGSILSNQPLDYRSALGDVDGAEAILRSMVR